MDNLNNVNDFNKVIKQLTEERDALVIKSNNRGTGNSNTISKRIEELNERINELIRKRNQKLRKAYTRPVIEPPTSATVVPCVKLGTELRPNITKMNIGHDKTKLKMAPSWFDADDEQEALKGIVYPSDTVDQRSFNTVARYRMATGQSNNFRQQPINVDENSTETLILMLDAFAQQFGADLSFTNGELPFDESAYRTACGVANLGSAHLLPTNNIPTAGFSVLVHLDYDKNLAKSNDTMKDFLLNFTQAIARKLNIPEDYVRVFSVEKSVETPNTTIVHFGLTSPNQKETKQMADDFQERARLGFEENAILHYIKPAEYPYSWAPMLSYLQLRPSDFAPAYNMDYRKSGMPESQHRGGYTYYLPIGWYRHALKVDQKYPDDAVWLGSTNGKGEWPVAFHGTDSRKISGVASNGLIVNAAENDFVRQEAVEQMGPTMDQPGIYLTTHCDGGAHPQYTRPFYVQLPDRTNKTFRVVFMCRVQPGKFTTHHVPTSTGLIWRVVDPNAVRPYGILVKDEDTPDKI
ncbi:unnamed protein product [Rotaria socialis]|uniref:Uncharacterized protein n=3 Tax=Rotaria socialis TaxID=392032 RepID=A0A818E6Y1_9BILA|nr:unnamed protein product [Rotaria socialis]CAF4508194.1 unnamed protein product [Rotaria socialis]